MVRKRKFYPGSEAAALHEPGQGANGHGASLNGAPLNGAAVAESLDISKAGCLIFGLDADAKGYQRTMLLAKQTVGRYHDTYPAPGFAKGTIEQTKASKEAREAYEALGKKTDGIVKPKKHYESTWDAACRETLEETGIDIEKLLRGEYEGVRVKKQHATIEANFVGGGDEERRIAFYPIELEDGCINNLRAHIKGWGKDASMQKELKALPSLKEMIGVLRSGKFPECKGHKASKIIEDPALPSIEKDVGKRTGIAFLKPIKDGNQLYGQWRSFFNALNEKEREALMRDVKAIKAHLSNIGAVEDHGVIKMDDKVVPGYFFTEVGEILPVGELLRKAVHLAKLSPAFAQEFWGVSDVNDRKVLAQMIPRSQLAPVIQFFSEIRSMEILDADSSRNKKSRYVDPIMAQVLKITGLDQPVPRITDPVREQGLKLPRAVGADRTP